MCTEGNPSHPSWSQSQPSGPVPPIGGSTAEGHDTAKIKLTYPFCQYSLQEVCLFLRLLYQPPVGPQGCDLLNVTAAHSPALLRLAHQLDAAPLLEWLTDVMVCRHWHASDGRGRGKAQLDHLAAFATAADACQLDDVCQLAIRRLAIRMTAPGSFGLDEAHALAGAMSTTTMASLLVATLPGARDGKHHWMVPNFSTLDAPFLSSTFMLAGAEWRLGVYPRNDERGPVVNNGTATHCGLLIECMTKRLLPLIARCRLTVHGRDPADDVHTELEREFHKYQAYGKTNMVPLDQLQERCLQDDVLRVSVTQLSLVASSWIEFPY